MRPHQKRMDESTMPGSGDRFTLFRNAVERFVDAGYQWLGIDHFAKAEDPLALAADAGRLHRKFMGYTTRRQTDLIGFGVSAISQIADCYAQNAKDIQTWSARIDAGKPATVRGLFTDRDDRIRAEVIQAIMCQGGLSFRDIEARFDIDFRHYFRHELEVLPELAEDGLLALDADHLQVLPPGRLLLRVIAARFDAYLPGRARAASPLLKAL